MNCKAVQNNLSAYIDRELTGEEMLLVRHHLGQCPPCREEELALRSLKALLSGLPASTPSPDFEARLIASLHREEPPARGREWMRSAALVLGTTAASMAITLAVLSHFSGSREVEARYSKMPDVAFEVQRDQIYAVSADPTSGSPMIDPNYHGR